MIKKNIVKSANEALEKISENIQEFRCSFEETVNSADAELADGGRIHELERIWHKLRMGNDTAISDYVSEMLQSIDEDEVIELKKLSSNERG